MTKKLVVTVFGTIILVVTVIMTISYINPNNKHKSNNDSLKQMNQNKKTKDDVKNKSDDSKTASDYKKIHIAVLVIHLIIEKMDQTHLVHRQIIEKIIQDKTTHKRVLKLDHRCLRGKIFHRMKTKQNIKI